MSTLPEDRIPALLRRELAAVTGEPEGVFVDDAMLGDVGVDSLALIEALMNVRDQLLAELGLTADEAGEPPTLPWLETVGDLVAYVRSSLPASVNER